MESDAGFDGGAKVLPEVEAVGHLGRVRGAGSGAAGVGSPDGGEHRTGIWIADQKQRRERRDSEQRAALAEPGMGWAR
ncbi:MULTISPECIES: hypothetical protein [Streptomyces]|uniref:hypothetical protein n=1 Tax=Streptomyces TaxID=1883 RepID=UPI000F4302A6|nr:MULTISPECIES: hypothetical protein [unclassified Streptomyces]AYV32437.1 hypothetical protein EES41_37380 [Streptomyces sp. ADI95-16]